MHRLKMLLLLFVLLLLVMPHTARASDIAVVANADVPVDNLTLAELRKLVLGDRQFWRSDLRVSLLIRAPSARERDVILNRICQMTEAQFRQYWIGKVFRAESPAGPKTVYSSTMAISLASTTPGSLTFMDAADVPRGLKVIRIEGFLPGERDYPLNKE
jgi:hypothetical protein